MSQKKIIVLLTIIVVVITLSLSSIVSLLLESHHDVYLPSVGNIKAIGVEVYMDEQLQNKAESIDWGTVYPGSVTNVTRYVRSTSNRDISLNMTVGNLQYHNSTGVVPNGKVHVHVYWDSEGKILEPNEHSKVTFTLSLDSSYDFIEFLVVNDVRGFSVDMRIKASE